MKEEAAQDERFGRAGVAAKTINGVWLNWDNWRELLEKVHGTKEIEKHQRKMNQILLEERQLHGRSVEKLMSEKRNLEISEYKTRLEKDALEELVRVLTNEKQGLERGLEGLQKKQADQSIQLKGMKRDLEKVQDELAEETSRCREAMENYSQVLDENAILRKKNKEMEGSTQMLEKRLGEAITKLAVAPPDAITRADRLKDSELVLEGILNKMEIACRDQETAFAKENSGALLSSPISAGGQLSMRSGNNNSQGNSGNECSNRQSNQQSGARSIQNEGESESWLPRRVVYCLKKFLISVRMPEDMVPPFTDLIIESSQAWRAHFRQRIKKLQQIMNEEVEEHKRKLNRRASYQSTTAKEKIAHLQKELKASKERAHKIIHSFTKS